METRINVGDPQAIKHYSTRLAIEYTRKLWWTRMTGETENSIVQEIIDLESNAGDTVQYDLSMSLRGEAVIGDDRAEGKEESLKFLIDEIKIDQVRKPTDGGGRMTRKRTLHDLRKLMKRHTSDYMAKWGDELRFQYVSGVAGDAVANEDRVYKLASFAGNPVEAPDAAHMIYPGAVTSKASMTAADKMTIDLIRRVAVKAKMLNSRDPNVVSMQPVDVDGGENFVVVMTPDQSYDLRTAASQTDWLEIQKHAGSKGKDNPLFTGAMGKVDKVVLQEHDSVCRFTDYGAGGNVHAARAVFMGRQALGVAYGNANNNGTRMMWAEDLRDFGNSVAIAAGTICGVKKTRFKPKDGSGTGTDFGVIAMDTAARASY